MQGELPVVWRGDVRYHVKVGRPGRVDHNVKSVALVPIEQIVYLNPKHDPALR